MQAHIIHNPFAACLILSLTFSLIGCDEDDSGLKTKLVGVYQIDSWTENTETCDSAGDPKDEQATQDYVAVIKNEFSLANIPRIRVIKLLFGY